MKKIFTTLIYLAASKNKWPDNEHAKLLPKPEGIAIDGKKAIYNAYSSGRRIVITGRLIKDYKACTDQLKKPDLLLLEMVMKTLLLKIPGLLIHSVQKTAMVYM